MKSWFSFDQDNIWSIESVKLERRKLDSTIWSNIPFHTVKIITSISEYYQNFLDWLANLTLSFLMSPSDSLENIRKPKVFLFSGGSKEILGKKRLINQFHDQCVFEFKNKKHEWAKWIQNQGI